MILYWYCVSAGILTIILNFYLLINYKKIKQLSSLPLITEQPPVVIIIAARNEEDDLEKTLQSICNLNYHNYRVIVVDDRSTDRTAEILKNFSERYPKLTTITITSLPEGWLGKNNALYQGYSNSTEEWILFADADIVFHPDAINRALGYVVRNKIDHLTILPELISRSTILNSVFATFIIMLMIHMKPWDAKNPKSKASAGIGAFNLISRSAYEKIGTHTRIKLRPDDDLQLGKIIKEEGLRQDVLAGNRYICLEWYKSLKDFSKGLEKNSFSTSNYNILTAIFNLIFMLLTVALPVPVMLIFGTTDIRLLACFLLALHVMYMVLVPPNKWWYAFMVPLSGFIIAWVFLKSTVITVKQGGIYWRGSFYSLEMLKAKS
jgi:glycosyltransferase involved in cell wall biosynthesis